MTILLQTLALGSRDAALTWMRQAAEEIAAERSPLADK
jgi:hypothetical protein